MLKIIALMVVVITGIHASDYELEITLKNDTNKTIVLQNVRDSYTNISNIDIGEGFEISPQETLTFRSFVLPISYCRDHTVYDEIAFIILDENFNSQQQLKPFEILWDKDVASTGDLKKWHGYSLSGPSHKNNNKQFIFTIS